MVKTPPSNAGRAGLILGQGTKAPHAAGCGPNFFKGWGLGRWWFPAPGDQTQAQ